MCNACGKPLELAYQTVNLVWTKDEAWDEFHWRKEPISAHVVCAECNQELSKEEFVEMAKLLTKWAKIPGWKNPEENANANHS